MTEVKKPAFPQTAEGVTDWEKVFEDPEHGLVTLIQDAQSQEALRACTLIVIQQLFTRKNDQLEIARLKNQLDEIFGGGRYSRTDGSSHRPSTRNQRPPARSRDGVSPKQTNKSAGQARRYGMGPVRKPALYIDQRSKIFLRHSRHTAVPDRRCSRNAGHTVLHRPKTIGKSPDGGRRGNKNACAAETQKDRETKNRNAIKDASTADEDFPPTVVFSIFAAARGVRRHAHIHAIGSTCDCFEVRSRTITALWHSTEYLGHAKQPFQPSLCGKVGSEQPGAVTDCRTDNQRH